MKWELTKCYDTILQWSGLMQVSMITIVIMIMITILTMNRLRRILCCFFLYLIDFFLLFFFPVLSARVWVLWAFALFVSTNTLVCQHLNLSVLNKANKNLCTHLSHEQLGVYCHFRYITFWHKINVNFRFLPLILLLCQLVSAKIILSRSIHFLARKCMVVDLHQFWKKKKRRLPLLLNSCYL